MAILLVDHETYRIQSLSRGLRIKGYEVIEAMTPSDALSCIIHQGVHIDLIITDRSTRILYSPAMLKALRERAPEIQVVTMTDKAKGIHEELESLPWSAHFLEKPFTEAELIRLVEIVGARTSDLRLHEHHATGDL